MHGAAVRRAHDDAARRIAWLAAVGMLLMQRTCLMLIMAAWGIASSAAPTKEVLRTPGKDGAPNNLKQAALVPPPPFPWVVDTTKDLLDDTRVRWASLTGLLNRDAPRVGALVGWSGFRQWVPYLEQSRGVRFSNVSRSKFYGSARVVLPQLVQRKIVYSWAEPWTLPTVLSLCGIHSALAVAAEHDDAPELSTVMNCSGRWATAAEASRYLLGLRQQGQLPESFVNQSLMVLQDPGMLSQGFNADLVVAMGLWAFWLDGLCPTDTANNP